MTQGWKKLIPLLGVFFVACPGTPPPKAPAPAIAKQKPEEKVSWQVSKSGLGFRLSNADPERPDRPRVAKAEPLEGNARQDLFRRLPKFKQEGQKKTFAMRAKSIPAPRPGETIKSEFPPRVPAGPPPAASASALSVLRHAPEGDVPIAPNLSITFSEAMVPVTSHGDIAKLDVPVKLTPQPPGKWRWIGTQTVLFEPEGERFPMATEYRVEVPAGTRAQSGRALAQGLSFRFSTPELTLEQVHPHRWHDPVDLEPIVFARFNQRIDRQALLRFLSFGEGREKVQPVRLATEDEIQKDDDVRRLSQDAEADRWIALKPTAPLPEGSHISLVVEQGAPSAEGPIPAKRQQSEPFRVRGPLRFEALRCGWREQCPPLAAWSAQLSNTIDDESFEDRMVKVEPDLPGLKIDLSGRNLTLRGRSKGRTTYTVTLSGEIKDIFGQSLHQPAVKTIRVDEAEPLLFPEQDEMMILDPAFGPKLSVYSVNRNALRVKLYAVEPGDWDRYVKFRRDYDWDGKVTNPPGRLVATKTVNPKGERDALTETAIDLSPALKNGLGQVIAIVEPPVQPKPRNRWDYRSREWVRAWLQVTKLGLTAFKDREDVHAWVTDLATGAPVSGATVSVWPASKSANTDAGGIAKLELPNNGDQLLAKTAGDLVFVPGTRGSGTFTAYPEHESVRWFVFDDRHLYKPGEEVHVKGWVRMADTGKNGDLGKVAGAREVAYKVIDPRGAELATGTARLDDSQGFHLDFKLPDNANLGSASVRLELDRGGWSRTHSHAFQVQEFRRPEFEVSAQVSEGPHFVGKHALATVAATYFAGGGLVDAEVNWTVRAQDAHFTPPNRDGYHFGKPQRFHWWGPAPDERSATETWKAKTDGEGKHRLRIDFDALDPAYPRKLDLEANVTDVNRQAWSARGDLLVHPAGVTVGLREESQLLRAGQNIQLDAIVTDIEGAMVPGRKVEIKSVRIERRWKGRKFEEKEKDPESCSIESASDAVRCTLPTKAGGQHRITAVVSDVHGRKSQTVLELYVLGDDPAANPTVQGERVDLIANKKEYRGGENAEILVSAPFAPAEGVLTLRRAGVVKLQRFKLEKRTQVLSVPLDGAWIPSIVARVDVVGARVREGESGDPDPSLPKRPAFANGEVTLSLPPTDRTLDLTITPEKKALEPGGTTRIGVDVKDAAGNPVKGAALALVVVDESVLALAGYSFPDPIEVLYPVKPAAVTDFEMRLRVALMKPDTARVELQAKAKNGRGDLEESVAYGTGGFGMGKAMPKPAMKASRALASAAPVPAAPPPPPGEMKKGEAEKRDGKPEPELTLRTNFDPLAAFVPRLTTNAQGRAVASVKLPDNLTRYRVLAVAAADEKQFGKAESDVTARLPLMVRPSAPRFMNFGDRFSLPVVLQNQTAQPLTVDVAARASNAIVYAPDAVRVQVPANDRVEVRFPTAAGEPGTARFQIGAVSRAGSDAAEVELPTWTPATTEAFATYGVIDQGAVAQPVKMPTGVYTEVGQLEITTSSTALQGLTDAVLYLVKYPFDCNEQIASRMLAIAALKDVLGAFEAAGLPPKKVLIASMAQDMERLTQRQHWSGGFDYWRKDRQPDPFVSVHVAHALVRAKQKGFTVPTRLMSQTLTYLRNIQSHFPPWYGPESRRIVRAYSLFVRDKAPENATAEARTLLKEFGISDKTNLDALGWLLPILTKDAESRADVDAIRRLLDNKIGETAGKAHFVTRVSDNAHVILESNRRTDGILLEAMIEDRPKADVIPKLASGLLAHRKRGRWLNTQENVFILLALDRYFGEYEKVTPDFVARAWLGQDLAAEHTFKGRSVDRQHVDVPLSWLAQAKAPSPLTVAKDGAGRLYYRVGMQYVPKDLRPPPAEHGFSVSRIYEGADDGKDVRRDRDGTWRIKLGTRVRVKVSMVAPGRRYHVALVDPIPGGFEAMNPALAMTGSIPRDDSAKKKQSGVPWWWSSTWYEHQNLRDERVEAFTSLLYGGTYDYTYVARATTPGVFVVPPPKAEEMYDPETFGRGAGDRVIIQ